MTTINAEVPDPDETEVTVKVPGVIRRTGRAIKTTTVNAATHPITVKVLKATGRGVGMAALTVVGSTAHGLALGYAENNLGNVRIGRAPRTPRVKAA